MENTIGLGVGIPLALVAGAVLYLSTTGNTEEVVPPNRLTISQKPEYANSDSPLFGGTRRRKGKKDKRHTRHNARKK